MSANSATTQLTPKGKLKAVHRVYRAAIIDYRKELGQPHQTGRYSRLRKLERELEVAFSNLCHVLHEVENQSSSMCDEQTSLKRLERLEQLFPPKRKWQFWK